MQDGPIALELDRAKAFDECDTLRQFRERFPLASEVIYLNGNSLGLMSRESRASMERVAAEWEHLAIAAWASASPPWLTAGERLGRAFESLVGAEPGEVIVTGTTTANIHSLVASFYTPTDRRKRILATELDFPSDIYALQGQLIMRHGLEGSGLLIKVPSKDGWTVNEQDIIDLMDDTVALAFIPSVHYCSGQLLDLERIAAHARARGILLGVDLCHSIGILSHSLSAWGVDFAVWCNYKWMNGGPGAPGGLYVHSSHRDRRPLLAGWWGSDKASQFMMSHRFDPAAGAGRYQVSTPPMLSMGPVEGALSIIREAGIDRIREKSLSLTDYMMQLVDTYLASSGFSIVTPREPGRRGGHVALSHPDAKVIREAMEVRNIVTDFRYPSVIRLAPSPLYTSYEDVLNAVLITRDIVSGM